MTTLQATPRNHPDPNPRPRFWALPRAAIGWAAAAAGIFFATVAVIAPGLQSWLSKSTYGRLGGGQETVATLVVLGLAASVVAIIALRRHERSILVWLAAVPAMLMTAFWVLFAAGELLIGHE